MNDLTSNRVRQIPTASYQEAPMNEKTVKWYFKR